MAEKKAQMDKDSFKRLLLTVVLRVRSVLLSWCILVHILSLHVEFSARISTT